MFIATIISESTMPRNGVSTNKINWFIWPAQNEQFVWGLVTLPFLFSLSSRTRSQFCSPGFVYFSLSAIQQCNSRRDWRKFFKNSLGTEKNRFFSRIAPLDLYRTSDFFYFFFNFGLSNANRYAFVHPVPYISDLPLSSGANYKKIGEKSLRTLSGLKMRTFHFLRAAQIFAYKTARIQHLLGHLVAFVALFEIIFEVFILFRSTSSTV